MIFFGTVSAQAQFLRGRHDRAAKTHLFGIYYSAMGDPFPSVHGLNLMMAFTSFSRLHAGYGYTPAQNGNATTYGGGVQLHMPRWAFTPVVGYSWAAVNNMFYGADVKYPGLFNQPIGAFGTNRASHAYYTAGAEAKLFRQKILVGSGYKKSTSYGVGSCFYFHLGIFL